MTMLLWAVAVAAFLFWLYVLWTAATMPDSDFPGRNDKVIWVMIVLFTPIIGALLFALWQLEQSMQRRANARLKKASGGLLRNKQDDDKPHEGPTPS